MFLMEINKLFIIFFFFFLINNVSITWSYTVFSPIDNYLVNCGSSVNSVINNRNFIGDPSATIATKLGSTFVDEEENPNPSLNLLPLHHTARIFTKPLIYLFEIKKKGTHLVRLHFFPFNSQNFNLSSALFHVSINGYVLLSDFNGLEGENNRKNPILKEYFIWVEDSKLEIEFTPSEESNLGFVNAIEVFSAPDDLIADTAKFVNSDGNKTIGGITNQALETVYRLTVGGPKVTPFNDTLWRTWSPDDEFLQSSETSQTVHFGGRIKYQNGGLSREVAPDNVYSSARVLSNTNESTLNDNITWILPVSVGYKYLVRMHFCDIASKVLYDLYFNVYINGNLAYENLDLSELTRMLASPYYADFVVDADNSGEITVSIAPSSSSSPERISAILNGLEVMKMNNTMGSLDGKISVGSIVKTPRGSTGVLVALVACTSLLVAVVAIMYRKRAMEHDSVAWSPLPTDASKGNQPESRKFLFF
ncbi:hypothetical protein AQUCO_03800093v1 [Aquilegia coerulea]|uniref:Malectin-like domain-containing protein n=1 Tax=Aquilegia coerulea TaxID=218851 RepID=A0A2G5CSJ2_AQUCA|nr:hypothetical protein AQUCO_03800093v1 [Aquilegia coerulea]